MDLFNRLKSFIGFPNHNKNSNSLSDERNPTKTDVPENFGREPPQEWPADEYERFGFNVFSSPLEMHRYFEHQMNEIIKNFGIFQGDDSLFDKSKESFFGRFKEPFGDHSFSYDPHHFPKMEDFHKTDEQLEQRSLRDQYLKSGYEQAQANEKNRGDVDIDGRFDMGDLDTVLKGRPSQPRVFSFGQSMMTQTIRNADGTVETHRTVTDQEGNREVTITRCKGDREYTKITKTNKDGHQEVTENFVNMDENEKNAHLKNDGFSIIPTDQTENLPPNWFPYDKFFK